MHSKSHNVFSKSDIFKLYASVSLTKRTASGFLNRMLFTVILVTGIRPTALCTLTVNQFGNVKLHNEMVWKITATVKNFDDSAKIQAQGWESGGTKTSRSLSLG